MNADVLHLRPKVQTVHPSFPSNAAIFHATKGCSQITVQPTVDPDHTDVESSRHVVGFVHVSGPDVGTQTVIYVVRHPDNFLWSIELVNCADRSENFFSRGVAF